MCGFRFLTQGHLKTHIKTVHQDAKEYTCEVCPYKARVKGHFYGIRTFYKCEKCPKFLVRRTQLAKHIKDIHANLGGMLVIKKSIFADDKVTTFQCEMCSKEFRIKS